MSSNPQRFPFKFNHFWLRDLDFISMVSNSWHIFGVEDDFDAMYRLVTNLRFLKSLV